MALKLTSDERKEWRSVIGNCLLGRDMPKDLVVKLLNELIPQPIPVSERLPLIDPSTDESEWVLAYFAESGEWGINHMTQWLDDEPPKWSADYPWGGDPTHWTPLPPKPPLVLAKDSQHTTFDFATVKPPPTQP